MSKQSRLAIYVRAIICSTLPLVILEPTYVLAREAMFDSGVMQTLDLNADLNTYFAEAPRFLSGSHFVNVKVRGQERGVAAVPGLTPVPIGAKESCHDFHNGYTRAAFNALTNQKAVELNLLPETVNSLSPDIKSFQHGGTVGLLNYTLFRTLNEYGDSDSSRDSQANLYQRRRATFRAVRHRRQQQSPVQN
ncbi:hypothetical protein V5093_14005 [Enterobacter cancerogenus]|uniref:hypothetical protein n=1 Tax=Enterobacter cancerogenus TaxID=69218 RepID=UPI003076099B